MVKEIRTICPCGLNKRFNSKFRVDYLVQHKMPEEGRRTHRPKRCEYHKKEDKSPNILNNKNEEVFHTRQISRTWISDAV